MDVLELIGYRRQVSLVVVSSDMAVWEISSALGVEPDLSREIGSVRTGPPARIPARENSWELCERSDSSVDTSTLIDRLARRVLHLERPLVELRSRGCLIKLDVVQWISPLDPIGPGFSLDFAMVELLAKVGGAVDVDQYVEWE